MDFDWKKVDPLIMGALQEDLGADGDVTTEAVVPGIVTGTGVFSSKVEGVLCDRGRSYCQAG